MFSDAVFAINTGDLAKAERLLRRVIKELPRHFDALNLLGIVLMLRNKYMDAERAIKAALAAQGPRD